MKKNELIKKLKETGKDVFTVKDVKKLFPKDAGVVGTYIKRFTDTGAIISITRGTYTLAEGSFDIEKLATTVYYPSYISFESALSKYGIINQGLYKITLATTRHTKKLRLSGTECEYTKIKPNLFFGFNLLENTYIAEPEKAFLDTLYLISLGKRKTNYAEWDTTSLNRKKIVIYAKKYGQCVQKLAEKVLDLPTLG